MSPIVKSLVFLMYVRVPPIIWNEQCYPSSLIQMNYLSDADCPFVHSTCPKYYIDCSLNSRVLYHCQSIRENIMKGVKNPLRSLELYLNTHDHCHRIIII